MSILIRPALAAVALVASMISSHPGAAPAQPPSASTPPTSPTFVSAPGPCHPYWASVTAPDPAALNLLYSVSQTSPSDAWAVGEQSNGSTHDTLIEHWDGHAWSVVPSPNGPSSVNVLFGVWAIGPDDVWAVGQYAETFPLIEHWDGTEWSVSQPPPIQGWTFLNQVWAAATDDAWIVGMVSNDTPWRSLVLHWDGEKWKRVKSPNEPGANTYPFAIDGTASNDVWIVGGAVLEALSMHWNGSKWKLVHTDPVEWNPNFYDLAAIAPDDVWAGGTSGIYQDDTLVLQHWDGTKWSNVEAPHLGHRVNEIQAFAASSSTDVWATGDFQRQQGDPKYSLIEHWDGKAWTAWAGVKGSPAMYGASALPDGSAWAVGYHHLGPRYRSTIERICPIRVDPDGFTPAQATVPLGQTVAWKVPPDASGSAAVVDASGLGLFDSGPIDPSGSFTHPFGSAASYAISNGGSGSGEIDVADVVTPRRGGIDTPFTVRWSEKPPKGTLLFDVQMRVPGSDVFVDWVIGSKAPMDQFVPDDGPGIYQFRSRIRSTDGPVTGWSPPASISVH
jgi:hypothetical protein